MANYWPVADGALVEELPEPQRNRLLRRADGRFLLPGPRPAKSVCLAGGGLAAAVGAVSGQLIEPSRAAPGESDLAVAVDPGAATLKAAWQALRPGGVYYGEFHSFFAGGAPGLRRRLEAAGFTDIACYWAWPLPERASPLFWLPVEAPLALHYYLASRPRAPSLGLRTRARLLQPAWRLGLRARWLAPLSVVARRPAKGLSPAGDNLLDVIRANWTGWGLGSAPERLTWLLLTGGRSSTNKVAGLAFADAQPQPGLIVKLPRVPESAPALAWEAATLRLVHASRPGGIAGVPQVVFWQDCAGQEALGETVLSGQPVFTRLRRDNFRRWALAATDWLADLAGRGPALPRAEWWPRLVEPALVDFEQAFGPVVERGRLAETRARLAALSDLPLVPEQRDFSPWNVLIGPDGELKVLDWESAEPRGLPALDLVYFLTYLAFFLDGAMESRRFAEAYRGASDPTTFTGAIVAECQSRYAARIGIDPAALPALRLLAWLIHSRSDYRQLAAQAGGRPAPDAWRGSLFVSLWTEELSLGPAAATTTGALETARHT